MRERRSRRGTHHPSAVGTHGTRPRMDSILGAWGRQVYRLRWWLVALSVLSLAPAAGIVARGAPLEAGTVLTTTESGHAVTLLSRELPGEPVSFDLILGGDRRPAADPTVRAEVERALAPLRSDPRVARVRTPYDEAPGPAAQFSRDGRRVRAVVELRQRASGPASLEFSSVPPDVYAALRALVRSDALEI